MSLPPDWTPPFERDAAAAVLARLAERGVFLGTSSWKYPGWRGLLYSDDRYTYRGKFSETRFEKLCLAEYASVFRSVGVDAAYYTFPSEKYLAGLMADVPDGFVLKNGFAKGGMTLVDAEESMRRRSISPSALAVAGGSAANTAACLASLGTRTAYIGKVGGDVLGSLFKAGMHEDGVHMIDGGAVAGRPCAGGVVADHAAEGGAVERGRVGAEHEAVLGGVAVEVEADHARLDLDRLRFRVEVANVGQVAGAIDHQGRAHRLAGQAGARAARQHRHVQLAGDLHDGAQVVAGAREDHAQRPHLMEALALRRAAPTGEGGAATRAA